MTEHKYTDEEVIKALECCANTLECKKCPLIDEDNCTYRNINYVLDLINRQKEKIAFWMDAAANAKKEAVKEFAEKLKHIIGFDDLVPTDCVMLFPYIDNLVKEFTEGKT